MNVKIIMMELKRLKKNILMGILAPAGYSALIMVFYIAFAGVMSEFTDIFSDSSLQGLLKAFSMDANTFAYILNFYVAYNGVYVLLMGIIFASLLGVHLFSKELKTGSYEFLYGNPISRLKILISKSMVIVIYLLLLNLTIFLVGFVSIELLKEKSPLIPWMSDENIELIQDKTTQNMDAVMTTFVLDEALFYDVFYSNMSSQLNLKPSETDQEIDMDILSDLLAVFIISPDGIYDEMLRYPEKYMPLFNLETSEYDQFVDIVEFQKTSYFKLKNNFAQDPELVKMFLKLNPRPFMDQLVDLEKVDQFKSAFGFTSKEIDQLFIYYSLSNFIELSVITFWVMLSVAMFSLMLTVVVPKGKYSTGVAIGVCMVFYLSSMVSNMTEQTQFLKYFTPLSYINMDVMAIEYSTKVSSWVSMIGIIVISFCIAIVAFRKSDLIS